LGLLGLCLLIGIDRIATPWFDARTTAAVVTAERTYCTAKGAGGYVSQRLEVQHGDTCWVKSGGQVVRMLG
jgi:hypothetical protein